MGVRIPSGSPSICCLRCPYFSLRYVSAILARHIAPSAYPLTPPRWACYNSPVMTSTLSQFPLSRLVALRRVPFWALALAVCALFAVVGVAIVDDYGIAGDEITQRRIASANADYIFTGNADGQYGLYRGDYRYFGVVYEMPLLLAERALGLQDSRDIYLMRHLITPLFFIVGGFVCAMLAYRMLGNRWIALLAMLLFLLHPRLYAHSFFNTKDIPFAALLIIALYLAHRAFRRDTIDAFLLCGVVMGMAINLRPFALMLPPMILAMRALDLWQAGRAERKHILSTAGIFIGAALATVYITHPYYWENPLRFIESALVSSQHPIMLRITNLFMGELYRSDAVPWNYIPAWFAITAPPVTLTLGAIGCAAVCWQGIAHPRAALRDREIRFRALLLGCFVMPVAVVIILQSNIYNGWRYMYFLWGPFCLLAAVGLWAIANNNLGKGRLKVAARLPGWVRGGGLRRVLAYGVVGVGLITTATAMAALHPHQQVYFNTLVDTNTPGALVKRYDMDYWRMAHRQSLEYLLTRYPNDTPRVWPPQNINLLMLPQNDRESIIGFRNPHLADFYLFGDWAEHRLLIKKLQDMSFYIHPRVNLLSALEQPPFYSINAYGNAIAYILAPENAEAYRAAYDDVAANGTPLAHSAFDIYAYDGALYYLNANCARLAPNAGMRVFLHIFPSYPVDLPVDRREYGFENLDFELGVHAAFFDGKCIGRRPLPDYPISRIRTGQNVKGEIIWRADIDLAAHGAALAVYERIAAGDYGQPVAQSDFDVYLRGKGLAYLKESCAAGDTDARFFLHIFPVDPTELLADSHESGFANLDFQFGDRGARIDDKCVAERDLPDYAIERIRTGQFVGGEGQLWGAEFSAGR